MQTPRDTEIEDVPGLGAPTEYRGLGPPLRPSAEAARLDAFLARTFPFNSRSEWKAICSRGHLLVNGRPARATKRLRAGDRLHVYHPLTAEPRVDTNVRLIAEAGGIMALSKPGNLPMHESGYFRRNTFTAIVTERFGPEWAPVHRLDRETSGVVLCAATYDLRRRLSAAFEGRSVSKRYLAIVQGVVDWDRLSVNAPLGFDGGERTPRVLVDAQGMPAVTDFVVLERRDGATLIEAWPRTGRPNQIRAHLASLGQSLIGDKIYHQDPRVYEAYHAASAAGSEAELADVCRLAGFERHALHAASIDVVHPISGRRFYAEAALPDDLLGLWQST